MKTLNTALTAILLLLSASLHAYENEGKDSLPTVSNKGVETLRTGVKNTMPVASPEFNWGDPSEAEKLFVFKAPDFEWGSLSDAFLLFSIASPAFRWGEPDADTAALTKIPVGGVQAPASFREALMKMLR